MSDTPDYLKNTKSVKRPKKDANDVFGTAVGQPLPNNSGSISNLANLSGEKLASPADTNEKQRLNEELAGEPLVSIIVKEYIMSKAKFRNGRLIEL